MIKFKKLFLLILFIFVIFFYSKNVSAAPEDQYIIKFKISQTKENVAERYNIALEDIKEIPQLNIFVLPQKTFKNQDAIGGFSGDSDIEYIEPDYRIQATSIHSLLTPNDTLYSSQWGDIKIDASSAWNFTTGSSSRKIAIVDTGINGLHEDLSGKVLAGYDYVNSQSISINSDSDDNGHGTAVSGVAAAIGNNNKGIAGVDWQTKLMPVKVLDQGGWGYASDVANGIIYATDSGADVINMSLGSSSDSSAIRSAVSYAYDAGKILVAATGNDGASTISYPARYSQVIGVGATDSNDTRPWWSNYGSDIDIVAPGQDIIYTKDSASGNEYAISYGTSLATPFVSGLSSLLLAKEPSLTNVQVGSRIRDNATKVAAMNGVDFTNEYGYGRINAYQTLNPVPDTDINHYTYQYISQNAYPSLLPGQGYNFVLTIRNTGSATWYRGTVNLGTTRPQDRISGFLREGNEPSGWLTANRVQMQEEIVFPGENATFSFWMTASNNMAIGTYREYFQPVADGIGWMEDYGIYWGIRIMSEAESYSYQYSNQNAYPTLDRNQSYNFSLNVRNTGNVTWYKGRVNLGPDRPRDRITGFVREGNGPSGWLYYNRIHMQQDSVAPGETATFSFWMTVPPGMSSGTYREYFRLVADGITWMEDYGIYWDVRVN